MIKTLAAHIKEFKKASIATPIFMILEVIMETLIPFLMSTLVDDGINKSNMHHVYVVGSLMVVFAIIGLIAGLLGGNTEQRHRQDLQEI